MDDLTVTISSVYRYRWILQASEWMMAWPRMELKQTKINVTGVTELQDGDLKI